MKKHFALGLAGCLMMACTAPAPTQENPKKKGKRNRATMEQAAQTELPPPGTVLNPVFHITATGEKRSAGALFGFNAANLLYFASASNTKAMERIGELEPQVLRFPGGTVANFYHPTGPAYGYREADLSAVPADSGPAKTMGAAIKQDNALAKSGTVRNYVHEMAEIAKRLDIQVLYVANILTGTDEEIVTALRILREAGAKVAGVEIGNECYLPSYSGTFPDAGAYLKRARTAHDAVKRAFPELPTGLVVAPAPVLKDAEGGNAARLDAWNEAVCRAGFGDALILHCYSKPKSCKQAGSNTAMFRCALEENSVYAHEKLKAGMAEYDRLTGGKKKIWITEWNIHGGTSFGNTLLQALFFADMSLSMADHPTVGMSTCHNLMARGEGYNAIGLEGQNFGPQAIFYVSKLMRPLFKPGTTMRQVDISGLNGQEEKVIARAFEEADGKRHRLLVINRSGAPLALANAGLPSTTAEVVTLGGNDLTEGTGGNQVNPNGRLENARRTNADLSTTTLPGYSISTIEWVQ
jgi:hypothetical protein